MAIGDSATAESSETVFTNSNGLNFVKCDADHSVGSPKHSSLPLNNTIDITSGSADATKVQKIKADHSSKMKNSNEQEEGSKFNIDTEDLLCIRNFQKGDHTEDAEWGDWKNQLQRKHGEQYSNISSSYFQGLEYRIKAVEKELLALLDGRGAVEDEDSEVNEVVLSESCMEVDSGHSIAIGLKEWKKTKFLPGGNSCGILLALSTDGSTQTEPKYNSIHKRAMEQSGASNSFDIEKPTNVSNGLPETVHITMERLVLRSNWPRCILKLLTGEDFEDYTAWIYPFKHFMIYENQFRIYVNELDKLNISVIKPKEMIDTFARVHQLVLEATYPEKRDFEDVVAHVTEVLKKETSFAIHFRKLEEMDKDSSQRSQRDVAKSETKEHDSTEEAKQPVEGTLSDQCHLDVSCNCLNQARSELKTLIKIVDIYLKEPLSLRRQIQSRKLLNIKFRDLWHLYQPGSTIVTLKTPKQAYRVLQVTGGREEMIQDVRNDEDAPLYPRQETWKPETSPLTINCLRLDFDGENYGPVYEMFQINPYLDTKRIEDLHVHPIEYGGPQSLRQELIKRGQQFVDVTRLRHKFYSGPGLYHTQEEVESEVMIDFTQAFKQEHMRFLKPQFGMPDFPQSKWNEVFESWFDHNRHRGLVIDVENENRFVNAEWEGLIKISKYEDGNLDEDKLLLLPSHAFGFAFKNRRWVSLNLELLDDIKYDEYLNGQTSAFEDLVVPDDHKKIVKALVMNHAVTKGSGSAEYTNHQVDLVRGKGKGIIILLHGVPGVGKTSTAETVAAYTGKPLFPITCGDLGQTASQVEYSLEKIFNLAHRWGCVLLLDEADIFLAKRGSGGDLIERNALVSVFLRTLEYYPGILFLTTNRIGEFDEGFISRIHISLYYPPLDQESTFKIWEMNLDRLERSSRKIFVNKERVKAYARSHWQANYRWNGRQIRNAFQTAIALAEYDFRDKCDECKMTGDKPPTIPALHEKHFKAVSDTSSQFDDYLLRAKGGHSFSTIAKSSEVRADDWADGSYSTPAGKSFSKQRIVRQGPTAPRPTPPSIDDRRSSTSYSVHTDVRPSDMVYNQQSSELRSRNLLHEAEDRFNDYTGPPSRITSDIPNFSQQPVSFNKAAAEVPEGVQDRDLDRQEQDDEAEKEELRRLMRKFGNRG